MYIEDTSSIRSNVNLQVKSLVFNGGTLESISTHSQLYVTFTGALSIKKQANNVNELQRLIAGFDVNNTGTITFEEDQRLLCNTDYFLNYGTMYFESGSSLWATKDVQHPMRVFNYNLMQVESKVVCTFNLHLEPEGTLQLITADEGSPFRTLGEAYLRGDLSVAFTNSTHDSYRKGAEITVMRYAKLVTSPFQSVQITPDGIADASYGETETKVFKLGKNKNNGDGMGAGAVVGIIFGVFIGLALVTFVAWKFLINPQINGHEYGSVNGPAGGYGTA